MNHSPQSVLNIVSEKRQVFNKELKESTVTVRYVQS
jgi:hypothetical protein